MEPIRFKSKKCSSQESHLKFPLLLNDRPHIGIFDGHSVSVFDRNSIEDIYNEGNFGKGSLSKSAPAFKVGDNFPKVVMQQQWENQVKWESGTEIPGTNQSKIYEDSIQDLLDFAFKSCTGDTWKKWKEANLGNTMTVRSVVSDDVEASEDISVESTDMVVNDTLGSMVNKILVTRKIRESKLENSEISKMIVVVEDIKNKDINDYHLSNMNLKLRKCQQNAREVLKLNLSEAFFLAFALGVLKILNKSGNEMSVLDLWNKFCQMEDNFIKKYVAYHQYRAHGWTVRSGIKFGGDYLLYKLGPAHYHASYLVWLMGKRKNGKRMTWSEFVALNRLVETCNKDLLLCEILGPDPSEEDCYTNPDVLTQFSILEAVTKRWIPSQERNINDN